MSKSGIAPSWQPGQPEPDWRTWKDRDLLALCRSLLGPGCLARLEELEAEDLAARRGRKKRSRAATAKRRERLAGMRTEALEHLRKAVPLLARLGPLYGLAARFALAALEAARRGMRRDGLPEAAMPPRAAQAKQSLLWPAEAG